MITRYVLTLASGDVVIGAVHGSGGLVGSGAHNLRRLEVAIERATAGRPMGISEPRPGYARIYPNACEDGAGQSAAMSLVGARVSTVDAVPVTAETITVDQIREVRDTAYRRIEGGVATKGDRETHAFCGDALNEMCHPARRGEAIACCATAYNAMIAARGAK